VQIEIKVDVVTLFCKSVKLCNDWLQVMKYLDKYLC